MLDTFRAFAKNVTATSSAVFGFLISDPRQFAEKLNERMRVDGIPLSLGSGCPLRSKNVEEDWERSLRLGDYPRALELIGRSERLSSKQIKRTRKRLLEQMELLRMRPKKSVSNRVNSRPVRAIYFLNNCLPYTQSGYTLRTQAILSTLMRQRSDWTVFPVTRLGYPIVIGRLPFKHKWKVEGVVYETLIPFIYPRSLQSRFEHSVEMLVRKARKKNVGLLVTTTGDINSLIVSEAAARLGIPWVYEMRGEPHHTWASRLDGSDQERAKDSFYFSNLKERDFRAAEAASAVIVLSEVSKNVLIERGIAKNRIVVARNATSSPGDINRSDVQELKKKLGLPDGPLIGSVSSLVGYEGFDDLIRSIRYMPDQVSLLLVGEGAARPELEDLVGRERLNERVIFAGRKASDEIDDWYRVLNVFVLPRKNLDVCRRVTPIKALRAQSLGIPVVASDLPALREITGNTAIYCEPENPRAIAGGVALAMDDPEPTAIAGREWAALNSWENSVAQFEAALSKAIKKCSAEPFAN